MPLRRSQHHDVHPNSVDFFVRTLGSENITIRANPPSPDKTPSNSSLSWNINVSPNSVMSNDIPSITVNTKKNNSTNSNSRNGNAAEHSVASFLQYQQQAGNDSLLRVQVESAEQRTTFYVPVSLMLQREMEMQEAAQRSNIDNSRWSCSRLFSQWKLQRRGRHEITLTLSPEESMKDFSTLRWKPWLTTCIRAYYNTGTIRIPDDCLGPDILLALEYFGILTTSSDTFVFDSYPAYERIKVWSAYFTHRNMIADWILQDFRLRGGSRRLWVATIDPEESKHNQTLLQVQGETAGVLWGEAGYYGTQLSCRSVYEIFSDNESESKLTRNMPQRMRQDFCEHLVRSLRLKAQANFSIEKVKITTAMGRCFTDFRPTLRLRLTDSFGSVVGGVLSTSLSHPKSPKASESVKSKDSTGNDLARMIGLQSDGPESDDFLVSEDHLFGSRSRDISQKPSMSAAGERVNATYLSNSMHQNGSAGGRDLVNPSSASYNLDGVLGMKQSPTASRPSLDSVEQRHPQRSSPEPDERRSSPENSSPKNTEITPLNQQLSDYEFLQQIDALAPVRFINTAFGDLGSVTSGLTGPFGDDSTIAELPDLATNVRAAWQKNTKPLNDIFKKHEEPIMEDEFEDDMIANEMAPIERGMDADIQEEEEEEEEPIPNGNLKKSNSNSNSNSNAGPGTFEYWDRFLASMCEAVLPVGHHNNRSASPVRSVTMATADDTEKYTSLEEELMNSSTQTPKSLTSMTSRLRSEIADGLYKETDEKVGSNGSQMHCDSEDSIVMEEAKKMGDNLTKQFDEFMKLALDKFDQNLPAGKQTKKHEQRSTIPDRLPMPVKKKGSAMISESSTNTSGRAKAQGKHNSEKYFDTSRANSHSDILLSSILKNPNNGRESPTSSSCSSMPKNKERRAASSFPPIDSNIALPPREPRRVRSKQNFAIARRKHSAQAMPTRNSMQLSGEILLGTSSNISPKPSDLAPGTRGNEPPSVSSSVPSNEASSSKGSRRVFGFGKKK